MIDVSKLKNEIACKENIINHLADSNVSLQKQLQQLKQENEELKEKQKAYDEEKCVDICQDVKQLKQENEVLNGEIKKIKEQYKDLQECHKTNAENFTHWMFGDFAVQKLETILDICKSNRCIDNNGYCPQIRNILEIIEE